MGMDGVEEPTMFDPEEFTPQPKPWQQHDFDSKVDMTPDELAFAGPAYDPEFDASRLKGKLKLTYEIMRDHRWHTIEEVAGYTGASGSSASAAIRALRQIKYGQHIIDRRRDPRRETESGTFQYRMRSVGDQV